MVDTWLVLELCPKVIKLHRKNKTKFEINQLMILSFILDLFVHKKILFVLLTTGVIPKNLDLILSRI